MLLTNGSGLFVASMCPWKVDVSAGGLCLSKLAFPLGLPSSCFFQRLHGRLRISEDPFAIEQDKLSCKSGSSGAWAQAGPHLQGQHLMETSGKAEAGGRNIELPSAHLTVPTVPS